MSFEVLFDRSLPHGRCVAVRLPPPGDAVDEHALARLLPEERAHLGGLGAGRVLSFAGGRIALREALARAARPSLPVAASSLSSPILSDDRGAPDLPRGYAGSVSHKDRIAVALVAASTGERLGVDVERDVPGTIDIARRVLRDEENDELSSLPDDERRRQVRLRFSAKEAIYKALDPFVRRYVGFREVSVHPASDGGARVELYLAGGSGDTGGSDENGRFSVEVRWLRIADEGPMFLTTARVRRLD